MYEFMDQGAVQAIDRFVIVLGGVLLGFTMTTSENSLDIGTYTYLVYSLYFLFFMVVLVYSSKLTEFFLARITSNLFREHAADFQLF